MVFCADYVEQTCRNIGTDMPNHQYKQNAKKVRQYLHFLDISFCFALFFIRKDNLADKGESVPLSRSSLAANFSTSTQFTLRPRLLPESRPAHGPICY
jgi:hypothetical protein